MKVRVILIVVITLFFSCKATKEKKACIEKVETYNELNISTFKDLSNYLKLEEETRPISLCIIDGHVFQKDELDVFFKTKGDVDILYAAKVYDADTTGSCGTRQANLIIVIKTNSCLKKYNK
ncbi:hypothetical protein [Pontimicrobium sp. IMCC45349]|uniref:hypothetical protein n=1 Tax=Pontimicrobium sp. IMCC45349 TaxID=3391574 RepID=UPI0039A07002